MIDVLVIRTDGTEETHQLNEEDISVKLGEILHASFFDIVNLRDGRFMYVDDLGYKTKVVEHDEGRIELVCVEAMKPVNTKATKLYHSICVPGTTHQIVGDVAIVREN